MSALSQGLLEILDLVYKYYNDPPPHFCVQPDAPASSNVITVRLPVVGPILKWLPLALIQHQIVVDEMVAFIHVCISPCTLSWPHRLILFAQI